MWRWNIVLQLNVRPEASRDPRPYALARQGSDDELVRRLSKNQAAEGVRLGNISALPLSVVVEHRGVGVAPEAEQPATQDDGEIEVDGERAVLKRPEHMSR